MRLFGMLSTIALVVTAVAPTAYGQQDPALAPGVGVNVAGGRRPVVPLEVQVVISKYQADKRISSLPYIMAVNANGEAASLNLGAQVPVPTTTFTPVKEGETGSAAPLTSFTYRNIGTNIAVSAVTADDGRYEVSLNIDESSVSETTAAVDRRTQAPVFKDFKSRNKVLLRHGQSREYTAATDRVTGETIKIAVTLTVVK